MDVSGEKDVSTGDQRRRWSSPSLPGSLRRRLLLGLRLKVKQQGTRTDSCANSNRRERREEGEGKEREGGEKGKKKKERREA